MSCQRVMVLDGNTRAALAIVRSLGRAGYDVVVGSENYPSMSALSKYCSFWVTYADPYRDSKLFIEDVVKAARVSGADILMPVTEISTLLITESKHRLKEFCALPFPDHEVVNAASDKWHVIYTAASLGIPIPSTICLRHYPGEKIAADKCRNINYPVVVKPTRSCIKTEAGWHKSGVKYAVNEAELQDILAVLAKKGEYPLLLQEKIKGEGIGVFLLMNKGKAVARFSHRRLREKPPSGGVSVLRESIALDPELLAHSEALLTALKWEGAAMVEFKRDEFGGDVKLMEVNGRFWGSLQLAIEAGVNFPLLVAQLVNGGVADFPGDYKIGAKLRWLWGDMDSLIARLRTNGMQPHHNGGKLRAVVDFMKFFGKDLRYEIFDRDDMGPWLYETRNWLMGRG